MESGKFLKNLVVSEDFAARALKRIPSRWADGRRIRRLAWRTVLFSLLTGTALAQHQTLITLDQAINLAMIHNHAMKASRTLIFQNQAQEITANLRPNPTLGADSQFVPVFSPQFFSSDNLNQTQQFDVGISYLFERGHKRQHRLQAARDQTAVTREQVSDSERTLAFNVAQQFISVLQAESTLQFAQPNQRLHSRKSRRRNVCLKL